MELKDLCSILESVRYAFLSSRFEYKNARVPQASRHRNIATFESTGTLLVRQKTAPVCNPRLGPRPFSRLGCGALPIARTG
jgi:hypothetical protein